MPGTRPSAASPVQYQYIEKTARLDLEEFASAAFKPTEEKINITEIQNFSFIIAPSR
jgi:hypothetical protein